jgi:hypothetical protein
VGVVGVVGSEILGNLNVRRDSVTKTQPLPRLDQHRDQFTVSTSSHRNSFATAAPSSAAAQLQCCLHAMLYTHLPRARQ